MGKYKFIYFNVRGKLEAIRLLLEDQNLEYELQIITHNDWPGELKARLPYGQLPCMVEEDGFELCQSNAILRHLARKHGLYGSSEREAALIDMINDGVEDLEVRYVRMIYQNYDNGKAEHIQTAEGALDKFEKLLLKNNDGKGFIVGDKISFADYNLFNLLDIHLVLASTCLDSCPALRAYHERIASRERIAKHRSSEAFKAIPINGNKKQ